MRRSTGRTRASDSLTELVDRAADTAIEVGDRASRAVLTTIDLAAEALSLPSDDEAALPGRRRNSSGDSIRGVAAAAARTNRKLAHVKPRSCDKETAERRASARKSTKRSAGRQSPRTTKSRQRK